MRDGSQRGRRQGSQAARLGDRDIAAVSWETTRELTKGADCAERTIETCHR